MLYSRCPTVFDPVRWLLQLDLQHSGLSALLTLVTAAVGRASMRLYIFLHFPGVCTFVRQDRSVVPYQNPASAARVWFSSRPDDDRAERSVADINSLNNGMLVLTHCSLCSDHKP
nr:hypothetical protein CFP56_53700 [Quercus suber]